MSAATFRRLSVGRVAFVLGAAALLIALAILAAICVGSTTSIGWPAGPSASDVIAIRRDRALLAAVVGFALGAAGAAYQGVLRNDLADPYLLGVASGATLGAYLWRLPAFVGLLAGSTRVATLGQPVFAFVGALAAAGVVLGIAGGRRGRSDPATVVLVGVIVSTLCGALVLLIYTFARALPGGGALQSVMIGELQTSLTAEQFRTATTIVLLGFAFMLLRAPHLNIAAISDDEALTLGLRVARERKWLLAVASLVTAAAVSVSGPIGFVGLIAPHAARRVVGVDQRLALPVGAAFGAVLLVVADAILRFLLGVRHINTLVPIGVATAVLGAPFFLYLLLRHRRAGEGT